MGKNRVIIYTDDKTRNLKSVSRTEQNEIVVRDPPNSENDYEMMAMAASLKWRLPTLRRKRHLKLVDFIDLRHEMRRTQEENNDDDLDYQNYYYSDSSLFPDLVMKSRAHRLSSEEANYQQNVSPNNNDSSSLIPRSSKLVVSMLDDYDNENDNDDYENRSRNRSHRLSKRRAFNLSTNSNVFLEYINIIGNPSMVEKYLSDTVRLQPKEKQRKERQIREVTDLTKKFEDLELSYRKRRTPNFIDVSKLRKSNNLSKLEVSKAVEQINESKSSRSNHESVVSNTNKPAKKIRRFIDLNREKTVVVYKRQERENKPEEQHKSHHKKFVPVSKRLPRISKPQEMKTKPNRKEAENKKKESIKYDREYKQIEEVELSLSSSESDVEKEVKTEEAAPEQRPKAAKLERKEASTMTNEMMSVEELIMLREQSIEKRTKTNQKKFPSQAIAIEQEEIEDDNHVTEEIVYIQEPEPIQIVKKPEVDRSYSKHEFKRGLFRSRKKAQNETSAIVIEKAENEPEPPEEAEPDAPVEPVHRRKIDFNFFNFFGRKRRNQIPESDDGSDAEVFVGLCDDWLFKWCIFNEKKQKQCERVFAQFDRNRRGYLIGEQLLDAIDAISKLNNLKTNYLFSVLKLCEADPLAHGADLKLFTLIVSLAYRIKHLDDDWFNNMLPNLDLSTVENKMFKVKNLWSILSDRTTKMIDIEDLMIEFEAGGVTPEHLAFARSKFSNKSHFDLLDYLSYIPLFVFIHDRIVRNPLNEKKDL